MKFDSPKFCLLASLLIHLTVCGAVIIFGPVQPVRQETALPLEDNVITVTMIAAPEAPPEILTPEIKPPAPAPPVEIPIPQEPQKTALPVVPPPAPVVVVAPVVMIAKPVPPAPAAVRGDASSPEPGRDATTQQPHITVRAEPNYLKNPEPPYPLTARRRHQEGLVLLAVQITAQGRAAGITLKQSSGFPILDEAARQAVRDWQFQPATINAQPAASEIEVPVRFKLTE